ncbi:MAG: HAD-IA family hydrolase [Methanocellales archaeon]|nr:HAD-IA family hydrolase [Methanocellales archaeon]
MPVIFDYDGTLVNSFEAHLRSYRKLFSELGVEIEDEEVTKRFGRSTVAILLEVLPHKFHGNVERLAWRKQQYFNEFLEGLRLYPGVKEVLEALKRRSVPTGLASSMNRLSLHRSLRDLGIERYFDAIVSADDIERGKPDPDILLEMARKLGEKPENCMVVGDSIHDVLAASKANMKIVIVANNPYQLREIEGESVPIVKKMTDILEMCDLGTISGVKIRQFRCEDLKKVLEIDEEFPPTSRELISDKDALKLSRQNPRGCLVAEKEGKVVGFIFSELREGSCTIKFLQVLPECMGESIVAKLMDEAMRATKANVLSGQP